MKISVNWLKDYVDIDVTPAVLADKMVSVGFEVEEIIDLSAEIKNVVTGKILTADQHPNADKLHVCTVDVGEKVLQIVCGANNANPGAIVPVALEGAELPGGKKIGAGELRGVKSYGMLCSGGELGLTDADYEGAGYDGLFILPEDTKLGMDFNKFIGNDDYILDFSITANRPDCNSVIGIAREVAAVLGKPLKSIPVKYKTINDKASNYIAVEVKAPDLCPRYMAKVVKGAKVERSPEFIRRRLRAVGLRPINNLVDITNYVLIDIGQPMHAFDIRELQGSKIIVRRAADGEKITALDGVEYKLNKNTLTICDAIKPVAIGGIMGGEKSGVVSDTTTIVLESARFNRENIRRSSRELNLRSDSSQRFEKGIDYVSQELAIERALTLLQMGEALKETIDVMSGEIEHKQIAFTTEDIRSILGIKISAAEIKTILDSLSIETKITSNIELISKIPPYREDIVGINDLAEEVIRQYGYESITSSDMRVPTAGGRISELKAIDRIKAIMTSMSAHEIVSYSFTSPKGYDLLNLSIDDDLRKSIKLLNPLGEDLSVMRTTLAHSMLTLVASNIAKGNKEGILYEIAKVYLPKELPLKELPDERYKLCIAMFGENDYYSLKAIIERLYQITSIAPEFKRISLNYLHPGISAEVIAAGKSAGYLGELHPDVAANYGIKAKVFIAEIEVSSIGDNIIKNRLYKSIPKYPSITRDLALVMEETIPAGEVIDFIKKYDILIENVELFDVYRGNQVSEGKKSIALKIEMRALDRTLRLEETAALADRLLVDLDNKFKAKIRVI
jgi:phenylalanyl-tRNA synthetase beta chain